MKFGDCKSCGEYNYLRSRHYCDSCLGDPFIMTIKTGNLNKDGKPIYQISVTDTEDCVVYNEHMVENPVYVTDSEKLLFEESGEYDLEIYADQLHLTHCMSNFSYCVTDVKQWGSIEWMSMRCMFSRCVNLEGFSATDTPDLSSVKSMERLFYYCPSFNGDIADWDASNVRNMKEMLAFNEQFNRDISNWNVGNVRNMTRMFAGAVSFNQNLTSWNPDISSKPASFDTESAFEGESGRQPNWNQQ